MEDSEVRQPTCWVAHLYHEISDYSMCLPQQFGFQPKYVIISVPGRVQTVGIAGTYNGAIVVTSLGQLHEILTGPGRVLNIQLDFKSSHRRLD